MNRIDLPDDSFSKPWKYRGRPAVSFELRKNKFHKVTRVDLAFWYSHAQEQVLSPIGTDSLTRMERHEFDQLRKLDGKCINEDVVFLPMRGFIETYAFDDVEVINEHGVDLIVGGHFNARVGSVTYNFSVRSLGPICRFCVNGREHGKSGRCHKHFLRKPDDVRKNLPNVVVRDDLRGLTAKQIWRIACKEAHIEHIGTFFEPEVIGS